MDGTPTATRSLRRAAVAIALVAILPTTWLTSGPAASAVVFVVNQTGNASDLNLADAACDTSTASGNQCSLRAAIQQANNTAGADTINFNIGTDGGLKIISPSSQLPAITGTVTINGYSQLGASQNTLATGNDAVLRIRLNGTNAGASANGLRIQADDSLVKGLLINAWGGDGIFVTGSDNKIDGNFIGTNATGNADVGNGGAGVTIAGGATGNFIGRTNTTARNLISGNAASGVLISGPATGNTVRNNYIGTNAAGTADLGNGVSGVTIVGADANTVGGTSSAARNLISGNEAHGVHIAGPPATGNLVAGNFIGTNATGSAALGNVNSGVAITHGSGNTIGGTVAGARNLLSGNGDHGVEIQGANAATNSVRGNFVGTDVTGTTAVGNGDDGVVLSFGAHGNTVGGTTAGTRNVISGNTSRGVSIVTDSPGNVVSGNFIGTDVTGTLAVGNEVGVVVESSDENTIGGGVAGAGNVISGNLATGVSLVDSASAAVQGNLIGTDLTGSVAIPNQNTGIFVNGATNNTIGGTVAAARNVISGNGGSGINISSGADGNLVKGNYIGTTEDGVAALGNEGDGVFITSSGDTVIGGTEPGARNVISGNGRNGIAISGSPPGSLGLIQGNLIGTDVAGTADLGNVEDGVQIPSFSPVTVGGTTSEARNVISGNGGDGVQLVGGNQLVQGNFIGTDVTGTAALGNSAAGISMFGSDATVGGAVAGAGNVISANGTDGISIGPNGTSVHDNTVQGNRIGTKADGTGDLGNVAAGITILASSTLVGGPGAAGNVISGNGANGVRIASGFAHDNTVQGNVIRANDIAGIRAEFGTTTVSGNVIFGNVENGVRVNSSATGVRIRANQTFGNGALGINLSDGTAGGGGVTANDTDDPDTGANNRQNFPVLSSAVRSNATGVTTIIGSLNSTPSQTFTIQLFIAAADPSGHGEGQIFLAERTNVTTDAGGDGGFSFTRGDLAPGHVLTATAIHNTSGDTSEFAQNRTVVPVP